MTLFQAMSLTKLTIMRSSRFAILPRRDLSIKLNKGPTVPDSSPDVPFHVLGWGNTNASEYYLSSDVLKEAPAKRRSKARPWRKSSREVDPFAIPPPIVVQLDKYRQQYDKGGSAAPAGNQCHKNRQGAVVPSHFVVSLDKYLRRIEGKKLPELLFHSL